MARIEGTWQALGSRDARWVLDYTVATPVAGATTTTASGSMTLELSGPITAQLAAIVFWDGTLRGPGHDDGASITGSSGQVVHTFTQTVTLGSAPSSRTYSFWWASQSPSVALVFPAWTSDGGMGSATIPLPARVYDPPSPPTGVARSRVGDSTWDVTWSHAGGTGAAPLAGFEARRVSGRAGSVLTFAASIGAAARSVRDTDAQVDDRIVYEVRAVGPTGLASAWVAAPAGWTTPAAPSGVTPTRTASGVDVAWTVAAFDASAQRVQAQSSTDGVTYGAWADVSGHTGLVASVVSRSLTSLSTVQWHRVRVVSQVTTPAALESASVASVVIAPVQAPAAPALLGPSVTQSTVTDGVLLSWVHASLDTSRQVAYEVQHRPTGGAWTTLSGGVDEFRRLTLAAGTYGWRARTRGVHASLGPWSAESTFVVNIPPTASILAPAGGAIGSGRPTVTVGYSDVQSSPWVSWSVDLKDSNELLLWSGTRAGSSPSWMLPYTLPNGTVGAQVAVTVLAGSGLVSAPASQSFDVVYTPPPRPTLSGVWVEESGAVSLTGANPVGSTYGWVGAARRSESILYVSGVEARRNLARVPAPESGQWVPSYGTGGAGSVTWGPGRVRMVWSAAPSGGNPRMVCGPMTGSSAVAVTPGQTVTVSQDVAQSEGSARLSVDWVDGAGAWLSSSTGAWSAVSSDAGQPSRLSLTVTAPASAATAVAFAWPQAAPMGSWLEVGGLLVESGAAVGSYFDGDTVAAVSSSIERSIDGGQTWQVVAAGGALNFAASDRRVPLGISAWYRAVATSAAGSSSVSDVQVVDTTTSRLWLETGDGATLYLAGALVLDVSEGHDRSLDLYWGRRLPKSTYGVARPRSVQVRGRVVAGHGLRQVFASALGGDVYYRDPVGRAFWASLDEVGRSQSWVGLADVSFTATEVDHG